MHMTEMVYGKIAIYFILINIVAFLLYGFDKYCSKTGRWRVPESTLLGIAVLGGSIGAYAGMMIFRHKTRKRKFRLGLPVIMALQAALLLAVYRQL